MKYRLFIFTFVCFFPWYTESQIYCTPQKLHKKEQRKSLDQAVTYTFSGGRFGDNLLAYFHAKWVSYKYGIPLLYKPFLYSDQLQLHFCEQSYASCTLKKYAATKVVRNPIDIQRALLTPSLLVVPYFPESQWERDQAQKRCPWPYVPVDWDDQGFRAVLKEIVQPKFIVSKGSIPEGMISVACHVRRGGGFDTEHTFRNMSLKFPQDSFFISEIRELLQFFPGKKLYVFIFTDDREPAKIKKKYEEIFCNAPVVFNCRSEKNAHNLNVLDDFFAMTQFDCAIHGESNFAFCAAKLSDYLYESQPEAFHWVGNSLIIDRVTRKIKNGVLNAEEY